MDKFVKAVLVLSVAGSAIAAVHNFYMNSKEIPLANDEQMYDMATKWAEVPSQESYAYGGIFNHLEYETSFAALADSSDTYTGTIYFTGDHWSDPRIMVVTSDSTGRATQVVTLFSYERINENAAAKEVPE